MGGYGSGQRESSQIKGTTDVCQSIDVRWLKRAGMLSPGSLWGLSHEGAAKIRIRVEQGRVFLTCGSGGDPVAKEYPVELVTTPCHIGGKRHWFLCPASGCGKRVAVLYGDVSSGGSTFACRTCRQLVYPSQREGSADRAARRAHRIADRLGWNGFIGKLEWKPKGMHWRTYERLCNQHAGFEEVVDSAFIARFGPIPETWG